MFPRFLGIPVFGVVAMYCTGFHLIRISPAVSEDCKVRCKIQNGKQFVPCTATAIKGCKLQGKEIKGFQKYSCNHKRNATVHHVKWTFKHKRRKSIQAYLVGVELTLNNEHIEDRCYLAEPNHNSLHQYKSNSIKISWACYRKLTYIILKVKPLPTKNVTTQRLDKLNKMPGIVFDPEVGCKRNPNKDKACNCKSNISIFTNSTSIRVSYLLPDPSIKSRVEVSTPDALKLWPKDCIHQKENCTVIFNLLPGKYIVIVYYGKNDCNCNNRHLDAEIKQAHTDQPMEPREVIQGRLKKSNRNLNIIIVITCAVVALFVAVIFVCIKRYHSEKNKNKSHLQNMQACSEEGEVELLLSKDPKIMIISSNEEYNTYFAHTVNCFAEMLKAYFPDVVSFYDTNTQATFMNNALDCIEDFVKRSNTFIFILTHNMCQQFCTRRHGHANHTPKLDNIIRQEPEVVEQEFGPDPESRTQTEVDHCLYAFELIRQKYNKHCFLVSFEETEMITSATTLCNLYPLIFQMVKYCSVAHCLDGNGTNIDFNESEWSCLINNILNSRCPNEFEFQKKKESFISSVKKYTSHKRTVKKNSYLKLNYE